MIQLIAINLYDHSTIKTHDFHIVNIRINLTTSYEFLLGNKTNMLITPLNSKIVDTNPVYQSSISSIETKYITVSGIRL